MKNAYYLPLALACAASLAGCQGHKGKRDLKEGGRQPIDIKNIEPDEISYGSLPSTRNSKAFSANYDALVYFGFNQRGKIVSTVRYFAASGSTATAALENIEPCVDKLDADPTVASPCDGQVKQVNLDDLTFRAPTNVIFATNSASLKFQPEALVFSKTLGKPQAGHADKKAKPNRSFYNATPVSVGKGSAVYVQNYYAKKGGGNDNGNGSDLGDTPIDQSEKFWYALNIFLTVEHEGGDPVKLIVDPDTGNMGGGNP